MGWMDSTGFDALVTRHHPEIYRYLLRTTFRASEAEDLAQETFLRAYRAHRPLTPDATARACPPPTPPNPARTPLRPESRRRPPRATVPPEGRVAPPAAPAAPPSG